MPPPATAAKKDAATDAKEARDQDEVAEESDVEKVVRCPTNEQQLADKQRRAREEQANARIAQAVHDRWRATNSGGRFARRKPTVGLVISGV